MVSYHVWPRFDSTNLLFVHTNALIASSRQHVASKDAHRTLVPQERASVRFNSARLRIKAGAVVHENLPHEWLSTEVFLIPPQERNQIPSAVLSDAQEIENIPTWNQAVNRFHRNVAFRANRIFNPTRIASMYTAMCNSCVESDAIIPAMSSLAYVGIPPTFYIRRLTKPTEFDSAGPLFVYDPQMEPDVFLSLDTNAKGEIFIDVDSLTRHCAEVMLDIDLTTWRPPENSYLNSTISDEPSDAIRVAPSRREWDLEMQKIGQRPSPHEWHYTQLPNASLPYHVRDMVASILRIAASASREYVINHARACTDLVVLTKAMSPSNCVDSFLPSPLTMERILAHDVSLPREEISVEKNILRTCIRPI